MLLGLVQVNRRAKKWQCPVCMKLYTLASLVYDAFFHRVCEAMAAMALDEEVKEVELKSGATGAQDALRQREAGRRKRSSGAT